MKVNKVGDILLESPTEAGEELSKKLECTKAMPTEATTFLTKRSNEFSTKLTDARKGH